MIVDHLSLHRQSYAALFSSCQRMKIYTKTGDKGTHKQGSRVYCITLITIYLFKALQAYTMANVAIRTTRSLKLLVGFVSFTRLRNVTEAYIVVGTTDELTSHIG